MALWLNSEANARSINQTELNIAIANATANREEESILRRGSAAFLAMQESGQIDPSLLAQVREAEALLIQRTRQVRALERQQMVTDHQSQLEQWRISRRQQLRNSDSGFTGGCLNFVVASFVAVLAWFFVGILDPLLGFLAMFPAWLVVFALFSVRSSSATGRINAQLAQEEQQFAQYLQGQLVAFDAETEAMLSGDSPVAFQRAELPSAQSPYGTQQPPPPPPPPPPPAPAPRR